MFAWPATLVIFLMERNISSILNRMRFQTLKTVSYCTILPMMSVGMEECSLGKATPILKQKCSFNCHLNSATNVADEGESTSCMLGQIVRLLVLSLVDIDNARQRVGSWFVRRLPFPNRCNSNDFHTCELTHPFGLG